MADYTWRIACPAAIFGADIVHDVSYDPNSQPAAEVVLPLPTSSVVPVRSSNSTSTSSGSSSSTYNDGSRTSAKRKAESDPPRNKFIPVISPIMPTSIHSWVSTSVSHDYILPEPALFANHKVESSRQAFFKTYLKDAGLELFGQKDTGSLESNKQKRLRADLQSAASASSGPDTSMDFDISNLNSIVPAWKDKKYEGSIPDDVCCEVLEEIFRMSFKEELLLLDRYLYTVKSRDSKEGEVLDDLDVSMREERNIKVIGAVILDTDVLGVASASVDTHQNAFYGLFKVMNGWTKGPSLPDGSYRAGEKLSETVSEEDLKFGEYCLAYHYILTYANFFKRPPTLPYQL
ncbi:hypothetical protein BT96DRAFT_1004920 [Gymnopus androsaceus JB14]|uniref:Uncharacterized protein n=1 Tax=Gymnopus androsaceus JB14 TaxID=1447944 RepID=A0A6A4GQD9_9AGAR|nr:hypothetical protein BT96DRAFT_1004920 [Gymnopus androsaceus JB14]